MALSRGRSGAGAPAQARLARGQGLVHAADDGAVRRVLHEVRLLLLQQLTVVDVRLGLVAIEVADLFVYVTGIVLVAAASQRSEINSGKRPFDAGKRPKRLKKRVK